MCVLCESVSGSDESLARRARVLQLLALIEHPDALPADAALRLGQEIIMLVRPEPGSLRCDPVVPPGPAIGEIH